MEILVLETGRGNLQKGSTMDFIRFLWTPERPETGKRLVLKLLHRDLELYLSSERKAFFFKA